VATDDLFAPLGLDKKPARPRLTPSVYPVAAGLLGLALATFVVWVMVGHDPFGGEPIAVVKANLGSETGNAVALRPSETDATGHEITGAISAAAEIAQLKAQERAREKALDQAAAGRGEQIVTIIDGTSGARQEVKIPAPVEAAISRTGLERLAGKVRSLGHELLLQVPMEPLESPEVDAAPQALLASLSPEQNIERLHWLMGRFQGYVGVANQMGDRLTASEAAFAPILREIGNRGLIYVDDGTSPKSLAGQIAGGAGSGFAKANLVLDAVPSAAEVDRALAKLEGLARQNGMAVGFATAWPVVIERIGRWSKTVEGRGFSLVPITAAAARGKPS
jgi:uncharacterized protein